MPYDRITSYNVCYTKLLRLQEGKVSLLNGNNELCLKPGEQVRYEKESNRLSMRNNFV